MFAWGIRLAAALAVAAVFVHVVFTAASPDGYLTVTTDLRSPSAFVSYPKPIGRLHLDDGSPFRLIGSPVYLDLKPPSPFETVTVRAEYVNRGQPLVEIGALSNRLDSQYDMRSVENRLVDSLNWSRLSSGRLNLLQRNRTYATLDDFLADPPNVSRVATYRTGLSWPYRPEGMPSDQPKTRVVSLRGHHRILTYTAGETLSFSFVVHDMNRQSGADPVTLSVFREGQETAVARTVLADDGNTADDQGSSPLRTVAVSVASPTPGLYRIEFTASDDVFIRELTTRQSKFVFLGRLYLGDHVGYSDLTLPLDVLAGGNTLTVRTAHTEGLQTIVVDGRPFEVQETNVRQDVRLGQVGRPVEVHLPRRDILLETGGVFALSEEDYFQPLPVELDWHMTSDDLDSAGIDFILTEYEFPELKGGLTAARTTFDFDRLAQTEDGAYRFALSAPGLSLTENDLRLKSVTFILHRPKTDWLTGLRRFWKGTGDDLSGSESIILTHGSSFGEEVQ
ncbi:hypothetical protein COY93_03755 [Candidatus Uhrbacteria bacterium CG_4_10_14_0_8_um_filter_58_22]|uniref:Uncharacterized protein n=1 Tax=Candidatus Uhrbacteria bacterium CG_4_10_14_0_8_um_filter_58_22 TaxID=1975029 RepID=A0A2M7Q999_9BACT|nr:MAG: hypothetical protein COY93_03755 [Candidatus Uhrbacteria bacterium CG_4_10_14_0_8_um_filter_58_22]